MVKKEQNIDLDLNIFYPLEFTLQGSLGSVKLFYLVCRSLSHQRGKSTRNGTKVLENSITNAHALVFLYFTNASIFSCQTHFY